MSVFYVELDIFFRLRHLIFSFSQKFFEPLKTPEFVEVATATMENVTKQVQVYWSVEIVTVRHALVSVFAAQYIGDTQSYFLHCSRLVWRYLFYVK